MRLVFLGTVSSAALLSHLIEVPNTSARVAEIDGKTGGRAFDLSEMQAYHDFVVMDSSDPRQHPVTPIDSTSCMVFTHKAVKSGNWSDPTVWNTGTIPHALADGTATVCTSGFEIVYDMLSDVRIKDIHVNGQGTLRWATTQTRLWVDTIMSDGTLIIGDPETPIPDSGLVVNGERVPQCEVVFWASEAPLDTTRLGISTMGPVRMHGAAKTSGLNSNNDIQVGATSAVLNELDLSNWQIGDRILLTSTEKAGFANTDPQYTGPTQYYGIGDKDSIAVVTNSAKYKLSQDEVRVISAIDAATNTISWTTPLVYPHKVYSDTLPHGQVITLKPVVANLSRSIRMRTADASDTVWVGDLAVLQKRAHQMFMYNDDVQIRYAESKNMGRTSTDPSLYVDTMRYATADTSQPISDVNNVRGRYPWHFHGMGPYMFRKMAVLHGCTAWAPTSAPPIPGWAFTHHNSRAAFEYCVGYNGRGALMVSEAGNEIGQWIGNIMCWCRGDGFKFEDWGTRHEQWENHNGHGGIAYENQARQVLMLDNLATSSKAGWVYLLQNPELLRRIPDQHSLRIRDPLTKGGGNTTYGDDATYGAKQAQIPHFDGNRCMDVNTPLFVAHRAEFMDREDSTPWVVRNFHNVHSQTDFSLTNYSFQYNFHDCLWWGNDGNGSSGADMGTVSWHFNFSNLKIRNKENVFRNSGVGANYNGFTIDIGHENISGTPYPPAHVTVADADVTMATHPYKDFMDSWEKVNATTIRVRQWRNLNSATELPQPYPLAPLGKHLPGGSPAVLPGEEPYFVLDADADTSIDIATYGSFNVRGVIRDSVGDRRYPDHQSPESNLNNLSVKDARTGRALNGRDLIQRNGCFYDNGVLKSRAWFLEADRFTGVPLSFSIDMTISGTLSAGDIEIVNANLVDPDATKPELLIKPETTRNSVIVRDTSVPVITSSNNVVITNGNPLYARLKASKGLGRWVIGGPDAAHFEIANLSFLRFAGNVVKDSASPDDADSNGSYDITLTFVDPIGNTSAPQNVTVSLMAFEDSFDGVAGTSLNSRYGWTQIGGFGSTLAVDGSGGLLGWSNSSNGNLTYRAFDLVSYDQAVDFSFTRTSSSNIMLRYRDELNFIQVLNNNSPSCLMIRQVKGGIATELARYVGSGLLRTVEVTGNTVRMRDPATNNLIATIAGGPTAAGVTTITMDSPPLPGYGCCIQDRISGSHASWLSFVRFRSMGAAEAMYFGSVPATAYRGTPYGYTPIILGNRLGGTKTFAISGTLPNGLSFDPSTGTISGTPVANGSSSITITATDALGSASQTVDVNVTDAPAIVHNFVHTRMYGSSSATSRAISDIPVGTPAPNRIVVLALNTAAQGGGNMTISSVTLAGMTMTRSSEHMSTVSQRVHSSIWYLHLPTDAQLANIVITGPNSWTGISIDVFTLYNVSLAPTESYSNTTGYPGNYNFSTAPATTIGVGVAGSWYNGGNRYTTVASGDITPAAQNISLSTAVADATWTGLTERRDSVVSNTANTWASSTLALSIWRAPT